MKRLVIIKYDGSSFSGSQVQTKRRTIQGDLEQTFKKAGIIVKSQFTSRTDAGVHAKQQGVVVNVNPQIKNSRITSILNKTLPKDIAVLTTRNYPYDLHPRHQAQIKKYEYKIAFEPTCPFKQRYVTNLEHSILTEMDFEQLENALNLFVGKHDFENFTSKTSKLEHVREITKVGYKVDKNTMTLEFYGTGFVRYQVRYMVGAIISLIQGKIDLKTISDLIDLKIMNNNVVLKAPPNGLYLTKIWYKEQNNE
jgi:tRNA pseudouridine38-40 synthase